MFKDRNDAGRLLMPKLLEYKDVPDVIMAVPRNGIPIAYEVAKKFGFPARMIFTSQIGHPRNKEYAIGAANLNDYFVIPHEHVNKEYIRQELISVRASLKEMYRKFNGFRRTDENLKGKTVIIIHDGIATANALSGTICLLRKSHPEKIIIATPVASKSAADKLSGVVDDLVILMVPEEFFRVGSFYEDFSEVSEKAVLGYLESLKDLEREVRNCAINRNDYDDKNH